MCTHHALLGSHYGRLTGQLPGHLGRHPSANYAYAAQHVHHQLGRLRSAPVSSDDAADPVGDHHQVLAAGRLGSQLQAGRRTPGRLHLRLDHVHHGHFAGSLPVDRLSDHRLSQADRSRRWAPIHLGPELPPGGAHVSLPLAGPSRFVAVALRHRRRVGRLLLRELARGPRTGVVLGGHDRRPIRRPHSHRLRRPRQNLPPAALAPVAHDVHGQRFTQTGLRETGIIFN